MTTLDLSEFARDLAAETKAFVATAIGRAVDAMRPRVELLEADVLSLKAIAPQPGRDGQDGKDGQPGRDGQGVELATVEALVTKALANLSSLVRDEVARVFATVPAPKDGKDGRNVDLLAVKTLTDAAVVTATAGVPALVRDEILRAVAALAPPVALVQATVAEQLKTWPKPKDGAPGQPGRDGTLEDLVVEYDGERTITLTRKDGSLLRTITLPIVLDRGVWKPGTWYGKGDGVTQGGSFYIAQEATSAKPGESGPDSRAWRMAVKRGTDGKPGRDGKDAE